MRYSWHQGSGDRVPFSFPLSPATPSVFAILRFCSSFVLTILRIACPATPFFSQSSAFPRVAGTCSQCAGGAWCKTASPVLSHSCSLFGVSKKVNSFAIRQIQPLFPKHPGWGVPSAAPHACPYLVNSCLCRLLVRAIPAMLACSRTEALAASRSTQALVANP